MTSGPTDWHQVLARVNGQLVRGEQRVATHELLTHRRAPTSPIANFGIQTTNQVRVSPCTANKNRL
jgi:hypothetical protein